jgi:hypothetical protein
MAIEHKVIPDAQLHEPKGVVSATSGTNYEANGAGSGSWKKPDAANVNIADAGSLYTGATVEAALQEIGVRYNYSNGVIVDVSTASSIYIPIPENTSSVNRVTTILHGAIATADAGITITRGGDGALLGNITVANAGSAEGDQDDNSVLSNNTVSRATHKYIKVTTDGASTNTVGLSVEIKFTV